MSYTKLLSFAGVNLPQYEPDAEAGTAPTASSAIRLLGGDVYDPVGSRRSVIALPYELRYTCVEAAETKADLASKLAVLRGLRGQIGPLVRQLQDGSGTQHYCTARLMQIEMGRTHRHVLHQPMRFSFEVISPWRGQFRSTQVSLTSSPTQTTLTNADIYSGTPIHDVAVFVLAGSSALTSLTVENMTTGCKWRFIGTINASKTLAIDFGNMTFLNNGVDAFNSFQLDTSHTNPYYFELAPGINYITITYTGGGSGSKITFEYMDGLE